MTLFRSTALACSLSFALALAQTGVSAMSDPADLFKQLPSGDALVTIDVPVLLERVIPVVLAGKPESQKRFESNIERARTDYGIDVRQVRRIAIAGSLLADDKSEWTAILDGEFGALAQPGALARTAGAYAARTPRYTVRELLHEGVSVVVLADANAPGGADRYAVVVFDGKTLCVGSASGVLRAIDVRRGKAPSISSNTAVIEAWGQSDSSAPTRFGIVLPLRMLQEEMKRDPGNPFLKTLAGIRFVFGTAGLENGSDVVVRSVARNNSADEARAALATLQALLQLGAGMDGTAGQLVGLTTASASGTDVTVQLVAPRDRQDALFRLIAP